MSANDDQDAFYAEVDNKKEPNVKEERDNALYGATGSDAFYAEADFKKDPNIKEERDNPLYDFTTDNDAMYAEVDVQKEAEKNEKINRNERRNKIDYEQVGVVYSQVKKDKKQFKNEEAGSGQSNDAFGGGNDEYAVVIKKKKV